MTKVVALERGHDGSVIRDVGEVFDIAVDPKATWYEVVEPKREPEPEPEPVQRRGRHSKNSEPDPVI
jgi:hypothetical protein